MKFFKFLPVFLIIVFCFCPVGHAADEVVLERDLEYINVDLPDVIRDLAEMGRFRVVLDRQVQGDVTLTLIHGVTAKEAVGTVARGYGYSSRWLDASTLMIGTSAFINGNFAARSTRIYTLKNADPMFVVDKLETVIPRERVKIDYETKELTITANIAEHQNISELVSQMDGPKSSVNLEIRVEEVADSLLGELQLEIDWGADELGAVLLSGQQLNMLRENANSLLLGKSSLTCFNNQEARVLVGDYLLKSNPNNAFNERLESGTRLTVVPTVSGGRLKLKVNTLVQANAGDQQTVIRGIHSLTGMHFGETVLINGVMQRNEFLELKRKESGYLYPILENLFENRITQGSSQSTRVVLLITPKPVDESDQTAASETGKTEPDLNPANDTVPTRSEPTEPPIDGSVSEYGEPGATLPAEITQPKAEKPVVIFDAVVVPENQPAERSEAVTVGPVRSTDGSFYEVKYTVKKGDTVFGIARKYGVVPANILERNQLTGSDVLKVDTVLVVPVPAERTYVVKTNETLWRIAKRYGVAMEVLMDLNGITDETKINQGQVLVLPKSNRDVVNPQF